jgi:hypothetical protein
MVTSNPSMLESVVELHTWQRWLSASTGRKVQSFSDTYKQLFGKTKMTLATLQSQRKELQTYLADGTIGPITTDQLQVDDALSIFELWLCIVAPTFFQNGEWIMRLTSAPVVWLPSGAGRLLTPTTLQAVLRTALGRSILERLVKYLPTYHLVKHLRIISEWSRVYDGDQSMSITKKDRTAFCDRSSWV